MNEANRKKIREIIMKFIDGRVMFTAWDVTDELRSEGHACVHSDVKTTVRTIMDEEHSDYSRTRAFTINDSGPYVYHRYDQNPNLYCHQQQKQGVTPSAETVNACAIVPKELLEQIGVLPKDKVYLYLCSGMVCLSLGGGGKGIKKEIAVKELNDIQIEPSILQEAGISDGFTVSVSNGEIVIKNET